jgi:hypothetical protein
MTSTLEHSEFRWKLDSFAFFGPIEASYTTQDAALPVRLC